MATNVPVIKLTDKERKKLPRKFFLLHLRPPTVPEKTLQFSLTWGLGGMAAVLVGMQFATGILLNFIFEPTPSGAYASILYLQNDTPFGQLVRNLHHWSANLLVLIVFLHVMRIFFTSAFHAPRQFNWIIGWLMFGVILLANFTGYLLPYDQLAYWAVTVATGMLEYIPVFGISLQTFVRGGVEIGPATLRIFFALHTALLPVTLAGLAAFHFWRIRKAGGVVIPRKPGEAPTRPVRVPTIPYLLLREVVTASVLVALVLFLAVFFNAPLEAPANPGLSPNPTKAPWYFAGFQELLLHIHPTFAVFIVPLLVAIALFIVPYLRYGEDTAGIWFVSHRGRRMAIFSSGISCVITILSIVLHDWYLGENPLVSSMSSPIVTGVVPVVIGVAALSASYLILRRKFLVSKNEAVQGVFIFLVVAFTVLTLTGALFRGKNMALIFFG
jgi:quinol-cytochrome oxidoreductase complex cytochrome b subunit